MSASKQTIKAGRLRAAASLHGREWTYAFTFASEGYLRVVRIAGARIVGTSSGRR